MSVGRLHAPVITATIGARPDPHPESLRRELLVPAVGVWRPVVRAGQVVQTGDTLGELTVLGVVHRVVAGPGVRGVVIESPAAHGPRAVDPGAPILTIDESIAVGGGTGALEHGGTAIAGGGLTVRAPSSGRFYGRPGPGKPAFVSVGDVIREGHTVCLLEVMKTFHRVTYGGGGLPPEARVTAIAVADEADVNSGDVLLHLEAV